MMLIEGDCLRNMSYIRPNSIDLILCDLPYGTTKNKWDCEIDLEKLWKQYKRVIKDKGCIALFGQQPFTSKLVMSNLEMFKYEWIWEKSLATGRLNCNYAPMKAHESIVIFSKKAACYVKDPNNAMEYHPQMTAGKPYKAVQGRASSNYDTKWSKRTITINDGSRYPRDVLKFNHDKDKYHPTQKPVPLLEYLIRTYTSEGETVLDNCMGAGSTGVAALNLKRNFVGIEIDHNYFQIAKKRIEEVWRNEEI